MVGSYGKASCILPQIRHVEIEDATRLLNAFYFRRNTVPTEGQTLPALFGSCGDPPHEAYFPTLGTASSRGFRQPRGACERGVGRDEYGPRGRISSP